MAMFFRFIRWRAASATWKRSLVSSTRRPSSHDWYRLRSKAGADSCSGLSSSRPRPGLPAGDFCWAAGPIDAADGPAVGCGVAGDVEIDGLACFGWQLRISKESKPGHHMERRLGFIPFHARVLRPET